MRNKLWRKRKLHRAIHAIEQANTEEMQSIILAVCLAMERKHPCNEATFLMIPRNNTEERRKFLDDFCSFMNAHAPPATQHVTEKDSLG